MKDKKRRNPSAKNTPERTGSGKKMPKKDSSVRDSSDRRRSEKDSSERYRSGRESSEKSRSGRERYDGDRSERDNFDRNSSGSSIAAWSRIRNILLVLLPLLIVFSLLYSAVSPPNKKNRDQTKEAEADTTPPQILLTRDKSYFVRAGEQYEEEGYSAYDNRDGDITKKVEVSVSRDIVRYRVKDEAGNITVRFRQIPRLDTEYSP